MSTAKKLAHAGWLGIAVIFAGCVCQVPPQATTGRYVTITSGIDSEAGFRACKLVNVNGRWFLRTQTTIKRSSRLHSYAMTILTDRGALTFVGDEATMVGVRAYAIFALVPYTMEIVDFPATNDQIETIISANDVTIKGYDIGEPSPWPIRLTRRDIDRLSEFYHQRKAE